MAAHSYDEVQLERFRQMAPELVMARLGIAFKRDPTFRPAKASQTVRLLVVDGNNAFELLSTGHKWFDARTSRGGAGAIDLLMHLRRVPFRAAVATLVAATRREDVLRPHGWSPKDDQTSIQQ